MNDRGQALVEFALVLPLLLALAFAIVFITEIGIARLVLENAAAEGARIGSLTNDDEEVGRVVVATLAPLDPARVSRKVVPGPLEPPRSGDPRGSLLTVRLEYLVPAPLAFAGLPAVTVRGTATRVIEWTP